MTVRLSTLYLGSLKYGSVTIGEFEQVVSKLAKGLHIV